MLKVTFKEPTAISVNGDFCISLFCVAHKAHYIYDPLKPDFYIGADDILVINSGNGNQTNIQSIEHVKPTDL